MRLTLRLTSHETGDTNDYKIFVKLVKDESTADQDEVWPQATAVKPVLAEQSDPPTLESK